MSKARDLANAGTALTTVSATELGYLDGVTSAVQTQIDGKQAANANVSTTELGYLDGVTSAIQTQLDGKVPATIVDAKGDLIAATAADTVSRLAVGANDTVLTADSTTSTGLKWATPAAGGYTTLASGSLSGTEVVLSSINGGYRRLVLSINNAYFSGPTILAMRLNGLATGTGYFSIRQLFNSTTQSNNASDNQWALTGSNNLGTSANTTDSFICTFDEYAVANTVKRMQINAWHANGDGGYQGLYTCSGVTGAITSITIRSYNGSATFSGGTYTLYGVK